MRTSTLVLGGLVFCYLSGCSCSDDRGGKPDAKSTDGGAGDARVEPSDGEFDAGQLDAGTADSGADAGADAGADGGADAGVRSCAIDNGGCDALATCSGTGASVTCSCPEGRVLGADGLACEHAVVELAAQMSHTCARLRDGTVWCWGSNSAGELGDGTMTPRSEPTRVLGLTDAAEIDVGSGFSCARHLGGTVSCWGVNGSGQLGDGSLTNRSSPVAVPGLTGVVELALGSGFACARLADRSVRCWGNNFVGQLCNGLTAAPVPSPGLALVTNAEQLTAGNEFACARKTAGDVECWG